MNVDIVNISTFGIWSQFVTIKYWFIHLWSLNLISIILLSAQSAETGTWRLQVGVVCKPIPLLLDIFLDVIYVCWVGLSDS